MFTRNQQQPNAQLRGATTRRYLGKNLANRQRSRSGFTLIELLVVVMIIGILASFVMVALAGVNQSAKEDRTTVQITKINELLMDKWQTYQYRRMPSVDKRMVLQQEQVRKRNKTRKQFENWLNNNGGNGRIAQDRLMATREMMRLELPCTKGEVVGPNAMGQSHLMDPVKPDTRNPLVPALSRAYYQKAVAMTGDLTLATWNTDNESAECLYLIVSQLRDADVSALEFFSEQEIGDTDGDSMLEILDAWGNPILWQRWAPAFVSTLQVPVAQQPEQEDMLDPMQVGLAYDHPETNYQFNQGRPRALIPLIFSAGPDEKYGILVADSNSEGWYGVNSDPYTQDSIMSQIGQTTGGQAWMDNITNHLLSTR